MKIQRQRHIAIEGCIGIGKTTLAEKLSIFRQSQLVLENFEKNPFLEQFYADPTSNVLENSLQFLLFHCYQIKEMEKLHSSEIITDFTFYKDGIFAEINLLERSERDVFDKVCHILHAKLPAPDLVIYIRGSDSLIFERVRLRNRVMESKTDVSYFSKINAAYERFFSTFTGRLHVIEAGSFDCLKTPEYVTNLSKSIDAVFEP